MRKIIVFLKALSVFLGTVVGVGIFGLPFVAEKSGFLVVVGYFLFMVVIATITHLFFGEVTLSIKRTYRLPGYVGEYLGEGWKKISFLITATGLFGALLVYLIVGGQFSNLLLSPVFGGSQEIYTIIFFVFASYFVFRGIKNISEVELFLLLVFLSILTMFFVRFFPFINLLNLEKINLKHFAFPFGIVLFSLWGTAIVPEVKEMLATSISDKKELSSALRTIIITGLIFSSIIYIFFIFIILGVSGSNTSREAIFGMEQFLSSGSIVIKMGFLFGIISCFTSFLAIALTLKKIFWYDFGVPKNFSWALACFLPLIFFLAGARQFIEVINFTGAIAVGSEGIVIVFLYKTFLAKKFGKKMNKIYYSLIPIFILGIIFELSHFLL